jgi:hypothetical protein
VEWAQKNSSPDISHYDFSDATSTALDRLAG